MTPTGPAITYRAIPFPLPPAERALLKELSADITLSRGYCPGKQDTPEVADARLALDIATLQMRDRIGVEVTRPRFLPVGAPRTNFRKTEGAV